MIPSALARDIFSTDSAIHQTSCHRSASKNPKDLLAGLLFFFFSSNRRSVVLKLYNSWYETLFFADRAVIAAILNSLDILLFRSIIRHTADTC